jgi:hypothetical protein
VNFETYISNNLLAQDEAVNVLFKGQVGETISERACTARDFKPQRKWGCVLCWLMELVVPNHCQIALGNAFVRAMQITRDATPNDT